LITGMTFGEEYRAYSSLLKVWKHNHKKAINNVLTSTVPGLLILHK
jgi:hypothetical protein